MPAALLLVGASRLTGLALGEFTILGVGPIGDLSACDAEVRVFLRQLPTPILLILMLLSELGNLLRED